MSLDICRQVEAYYTAKVERHGPTPAGVDWNGAASQELRFQQLLRLAQPAGDGAPFSLIDFGCGYGALYAWLRSKGVAVAYCGYDLSPRMIDEGRRLYAGQPGCRFELGPDRLGQAEYVFASGLFNVKQDRPRGEWEEYLLATVAQFDRLSTRGFAFNLLTSYSDADRMRPDLYYADPCWLFDHCKKRFSRNVALLHDYDLYEFTVLVRK